MATSPTNKHVQEEDDVQTDEVDPAKTTKEEVEVLTEEEDELKKEATGSLLESDPTSVRDEESDEETENQKRQEESITTRRRDQTMDRGSTSFATENQNRQQDSITVSRSDQMRDRGSTSFGPSVPPCHQERSVVSIRNNLNLRFGLPQPRWLVVDQYYTDGFGQYPPRPPMMQQQNHLVPYLFRGQAPPMMQQDQIVAYLLTCQVPVRLVMRQDQFFTYLLPSGKAPMMYYQEQDQIAPNVVIGQASARTVTYNQDQIVHSLGHFEAPLMQPLVMMYSPRPIVNTVPVRPMMNYNHKQQQQFNKGHQRFRFPMIMIQHHLPSPNAAAAPRPEQNQQLRSQTQQQPRESQGSNVLDSDPTRSGLNLSRENEQSDHGIKNQNLQEGSIMMHRSDQTVDRGSTSFASDQDRLLNCYVAQMSQQMMPREVKTMEVDPAKTSKEEDQVRTEEEDEHKEEAIEGHLESDPTNSSLSLSIEDKVIENQNSQEDSITVMYEGDDVISIGGRPKGFKKPNPLNLAKHDREARTRGRGRQRGRGQRGRGREMRGETYEEEEDVQEEEAQPQQFQSKIPAFEDGSKIITDWTTTNLFNDPIEQYEDTCASVVFARLTQAAYNRDKPIPQRRTLSYRHLADHIKSMTGKKNSFAFRNLKIPIEFLENEGLYREGVTGGKGGKTKGYFDSERDVNAQIVFAKLETVPLGIVLEDRLELHQIGNEIYYVPGKRDELLGEHALLVVGSGHTPDGVDFLVAQNSWGTGYANGGYCRISLPETRGFDIFWPHW